MEIHEVRIKVPGVGRYNLYPIGDIQADAAGFDQELYQQVCAEIAADPFPLTLGMGDYGDDYRPTVRTKIAVMTADDREFRRSMDDQGHHRLDKTVDLIKPVFDSGRGFCLGLLKGHHLYEFSDGVNSDQKMCGTLRTRYLDEMAFLRVVFIAERPDGRSSHQWEVIIHAQHGEGGAGFTGPDIGNLERKTVPYWDADLYLRGHSTKRWAAPFMEYRMSRNQPPRLVTKTKWAVNTGGFMRGHLQGESTYVSRKNMPPASLGYTVISIDLKRHMDNNSKRLARSTHEVGISVTLR